MTLLKKMLGAAATVAAVASQNRHDVPKKAGGAAFGFRLGVGHLRAEKHPDQESNNQRELV